MENPDAKGLNDNVEAAFSAGNLFGVSEVSLIPHEGGAALKNGAELTPQQPITDNTVSNMIVTIGDVNHDAIRPNMGAILGNFDASSKAMLPLVTALGSVAQSIQQTQTLPTSQTFPIIAQALQGADKALGDCCPPPDPVGLPQIARHGWVNRGAGDAGRDHQQQGQPDGRAAADPQSAGAPWTHDRHAGPGEPDAAAAVGVPEWRRCRVGIQLGRAHGQHPQGHAEHPERPGAERPMLVYFPALVAALPADSPQFQYIPPIPARSRATRPRPPPPPPPRLSQAERAVVQPRTPSTPKAGN